MPPLEDETSLRDELVNAFKADTPEREAAPEREPLEIPDAPAKTEKAESAPREPQTEKPAAPEKADKAEKSSDLTPPVRWTKTQKENFYKWPREVQEQVLAENRGYQADYTRKSMELAQERKRFEGFEKVLAPRRQSWASQGMDDSAALEQIMRYWDHAGKDPVGFVEQFAKDRGLDQALRQKYMPSEAQLTEYFNEYYAQVTGQRPPQTSQQGYADPQVRSQLEQLTRQNAQLQQQIAHTQQYLGSREQQEQQRVWASVTDELRGFENATDSSGQLKYPFYAEVREDMAQLLDKGLATSLEQAYDKATRLRDDVFGKIRETQEVKRIRSEEQRRAAEAAAARKAGASVSSSSVGYSGPSSAGEELSLRDMLQTQFDKARSGGRL